MVLRIPIRLALMLLCRTGVHHTLWVLSLRPVQPGFQGLERPGRFVISPHIFLFILYLVDIVPCSCSQMSILQNQSQELRVWLWFPIAITILKIIDCVNSKSIIEPTTKLISWAQYAQSFNGRDYGWNATYHMLYYIYIYNIYQAVDAFLLLNGYQITSMGFIDIPC